MAKHAMNGIQRGTATLDPDGEGFGLPRQPVEIAPLREVPLAKPIENVVIEVPLLDSPAALYRAEHIDVRLLCPNQRLMMSRLTRGLIEKRARLIPTEKYPEGQIVDNPAQVLKWLVEEMIRQQVPNVPTCK